MTVRFLRICIYQLKKNEKPTSTQISTILKLLNQIHDKELRIKY